MSSEHRGNDPHWLQVQLDNQLCVLGAGVVVNAPGQPSTHGGWDSMDKYPQPPVLGLDGSEECSPGLLKGPQWNWSPVALSTNSPSSVPVNDLFP